MPAFIDIDLFNAFKEVIDNDPYLKGYANISFSSSEILLYFNDPDFHAAAAVRLCEICSDNWMNYTLLTDPNLIKVNLWFYPQNIIEGSKKALDFVNRNRKKN